MINRELIVYAPGIEPATARAEWKAGKPLALSDGHPITRRQAADLKPPPALVTIRCGDECHQVTFPNS